MADAKKGRIRAEKSQKILDAAEQVFVQFGYKGSSLQAIATVAGLPKANLLYYFPNKQQLYNALLMDIVTRWNKNFTEITEEDDPAKTLERYIYAKVEQAIQYPNASKIFATELIQGAPNLNEYLRTDVKNWLQSSCKIINRWIAQGRMAKVDPEKLFFLIWSSTQHYAASETEVLILMDKTHYQEQDIKQIHQFLCQMILTGCGLKPSR